MRIYVIPKKIPYYFSLIKYCIRDFRVSIIVGREFKVFQTFFTALE